MYLQQYPSAYGWQEQYLPFVRQRESKMAIGFTQAELSYWVFIAGLWLFLQRPPLRTMGETRLWYSFFMGIAGLLTYIRWQYRWILSFSALLAYSLCHYQSDETRDTRSVTDAGSAKYMVHSPCHRIYVLLLCIGLCFYNRIDRVVPP